jgi:nitrate/nitrite transport system ATP-binding protein
MTFQDAARGRSSRFATSIYDRCSGEFVALIGHSGCGKSTLLNLVPGLIADQRRVAVCAPARNRGPGPDRGVVFQNHSLLPWLTCFDNVYLAVERVFAGRANEGRSEAPDARRARAGRAHARRSTSCRTRSRAE